MSNLNTILNKLGKIEAIHETNLGKHEVELATIYDNIKGSIETASKPFIEAINNNSKNVKLCKQALDNNKNLLKEIDKVEGLIKSIGLDSELKKLQNAKSQILQNINTIKKAYDNFITI
jgi:hypothetical protein